jgi:FkbM family methyltransferase
MHMKNWKRVARSGVRKLGYDLVQFRSVSSLGSHLTALYDRYNITLVIDVGGHRGEYGTYLRELGYRGTICSFEPVRENYDLLAERARNDPGWHVNRSALGEEAGSFEMNVMSGTVLSSFMSPSTWGREEYGSGIEVKRSETVPVVRLDDVFDELRVHAGTGAVMLKIDTQGFEQQVIRGASKSLDDISVVQAELPVLHLYDGVDNFETVLADLHERGFDVSGLWPVAHDHSMRLIEMDCIAVRPAAPTKG